MIIGATGQAAVKGGGCVVFRKPGVGSSGMFNLSTLNGTNGFTFDGEAANDESGFSISVGDINGDGQEDVVIGAPEVVGRAM